MRITSLFSGIGGMEVGLSKQGFGTVLLCEKDPVARAVLVSRFPGIEIASDVKNLRKLPRSEVLTAGWPCQDLSQAGMKSGIKGAKSGAIKHVFRLLRESHFKPTWVVLENVPYMLRLNEGEAIRNVCRNFSNLGYRWAYRVVDARAFGLPQRRRRVLFLASKTEDPAGILFGNNYEEPWDDPPPATVNANSVYGFYWTEGARGIGWTKDGVPPIKAGSTIGIPSPPALWFPRSNQFRLLALQEAEALQGFPIDWTLPASESSRDSYRWRLVGNSVSTRVFDWIGRRLQSGKLAAFASQPFDSERWPNAAFYDGRSVKQAFVSACPSRTKLDKIREHLASSGKPLSQRASKGFLQRAESSRNISYSMEFLESLRTHIRISAP